MHDECENRYTVSALVLCGSNNASSANSFLCSHENFPLVFFEGNYSEILTLGKFTRESEAVSYLDCMKECDLSARLAEFFASRPHKDRLYALIIYIKDDEHNAIWGDPTCIRFYDEECTEFRMLPKSSWQFYGKCFEEKGKL